jgi:ubiquinone/menaquinone biosynthesis C-methylase UbiE
MSKQQKEIHDWFDKNYKLRGFSYLRPAEAYHVYYHLLQPNKGSQWLDVACGPGLLLGVVSEKGVQAYGIDISETAIEMAKNKLPEANLQVANAEALPFADQTFDFISCLGSLERMLDLDRVLKEQMRVAKFDAQFVYLVRNSETSSWKYLKKGLGLQNKKGHQDAANLESWRHRFENAGFNVEHVYPDQWPRQRWYYWMGKRGWDTNFSSVKGSESRLRKANEFIFVLSKAS